MPAYPRKHQLQDNIAYHIFNRGNRKSDIFHDQGDYNYFKSLLSKYSRQKSMRIYHWAIIPNHYHFLAEIATPEDLPSAMAGINQGYTRYYHKKYGTAGFLWQGRFKSQPVQKDKYLLACGRYIERNPVRANFVSYPDDYPYSSAAHYTKGDYDEITAVSPIYEMFIGKKKDKQLEYKKFILDFDPEDIRRYNNFNEPVGDNSFKKRLIKKKGRYLPRRQGRMHKNKIFVL
jgi:putative transposase